MGRRYVRVNKYPTPEVCPYCGWPVEFASNATIYGREYGNGKCYKCTNCDAYVGVHDGTKIPLGILANKEMRNIKRKGHAMFDWYWNKSINPKARRKRWECYARLSIKLGIEVRECHFGWFGKERLLQAIAILEEGLF